MKLKNDAKKTEGPVDITQSLREVEASMKKLLDSGLARRAIVVLPADSTKLPRTDIETVINAASRLATDYLTPRKKAGSP